MSHVTRSSRDTKASNMQLTKGFHFSGSYCPVQNRPSYWHGDEHSRSEEIHSSTSTSSLSSSDSSDFPFRKLSNRWTIRISTKTFHTSLALSGTYAPPRHLSYSIRAMSFFCSSTENLAVYIWDQLAPKVSSDSSHLYEILIRETDKNIISYRGD